MSVPNFSRRAQNDLDDISEFIAHDDLDAAKRFIGRLRDACEVIAEFPEMGPDRGELSDGLRSFPVGNYIIFYRSTRRTAAIVRVLHAARDARRIFRRRAR